jgi:hypothetical protein
VMPLGFFLWEKCVWSKPVEKWGRMCVAKNEELALESINRLRRERNSKGLDYPMRRVLLAGVWHIQRMA